MSDFEIQYDKRVQNALRGVVRDILIDVAKEGLPGDHHFYVAFKTQYPGVQIPEHLATRFPDEMTIVLQHKFWGLTVEDDHFEVGLSFNQRPEMLHIPFKAVIGFVDPSVQFALQFQDDDQPDLTAVDDSDSTISGYQDAQDAALLAATEAELDAEDAEKASVDTASDQDDGAKVVTLDAFRKK